MKLAFTRNIGKPHIIKYIRDDGSMTWMYADDFFVQHDLSHYALESTLNYRAAFLGMLNNGMDIKDFEDRKKRLQMTISREALYAENMANLFLMEMVQGNFDDFNQVFKLAFESLNTQYPAPSLNDRELTAVRNSLRQLVKSWREMPAGKTMTLNFDC